MPKFVRRQGLIERLKDYFNVYDFLLWLSEEVESSGLEQLEKEWAIPIGLVLNIIFLLARSNSTQTTKSYDDVFGEARGSAWSVWLVRLQRAMKGRY